jgi:hypothetical protein
VLSKVNFIVDVREARLVAVDADNKIIEQESWALPAPIARDEAASAASAVFDEVYDYMNFLVHGDAKR